MASEAHEFDALSAIAAGAYKLAPVARMEAGDAELQARQYFEPEQAPAAQAAALHAQGERPAAHVQLVGRAFSEGRRFKVAATLLGTSASPH